MSGRPSGSGGLLSGIASDASRSCRRPFGKAAGLRVRRVQLVEIIRRRAVDGGEGLLDSLGDSEERQAAFEERGDCNLVRRVEHTGGGTALLARPARECQQRKRLEVWRLELKRQSGAQVERRNGRRPPLRLRERE